MHKISQDGLPAAEFDALLKKIHQIGKETLRPHAADVDVKARFPSESMDAIKSLKLMSAYVPKDLGGMGMSMVQLGQICENLGLYCGSTAMIYAMHQIQVACILHHSVDDPYFKQFLQRLVSEQRLLASATTEAGVGGDLRSSVCAVEVDGEAFTLTKNAPVISYGAQADDLLLTARRSADASANDQVHVVLGKEDYELEPTTSWDTMGFRGTCSEGFIVKSKGQLKQIIATPFAEILSQSMHPTAHVLWGSLWLGIASDAAGMARNFVREMVKRNPNVPQTAALRLAEMDSVLQEMRNNVHGVARAYQALLAEGDGDAMNNFGFTVKVNNLKISCSTLIVDIVSRSLLICGISAYRNDSQYSLSRHLRDAYGAALMVNNDRIMNHNSTLILMQRGS